MPKRKTFETSQSKETQPPEHSEHTQTASQLETHTVNDPLRYPQAFFSASSRQDTSRTIDQPPTPTNTPYSDQLSTPSPFAVPETASNQQRSPEPTKRQRYEAVSRRRRMEALFGEGAFSEEANEARKATLAKQKAEGIGAFSEEANEARKAAMAKQKAEGIGAYSPAAQEARKATMAKQKAEGIGAFSEEAREARRAALAKRAQEGTGAFSPAAQEARKATLAKQKAEGTGAFSEEAREARLKANLKRQAEAQTKTPQDLTTANQTASQAIGNSKTYAWMNQTSLANQP